MAEENQNRSIESNDSEKVEESKKSVKKENEKKESSNNKNGGKKSFSSFRRNSSVRVSNNPDVIYGGEFDDDVMELKDVLRDAGLVCVRVKSLVLIQGR